MVQEQTPSTMDEEMSHDFPDQEKLFRFEDYISSITAKAQKNLTNQTATSNLQKENQIDSQ